MEALHLYTHDPDKCFCKSTDFKTVWGKMVLNRKLEAEGYTMQCLTGMPAFSLSLSVILGLLIGSGLRAIGKKSTKKI